MKPEHKQWVTDNMLIFTTSRRLTPQESTMLFQIVSDVTNTPTKPTGCGRCVTTAKQNIMYHYDKERSNN